jgi:hypothetical protein
MSLAEETMPGGVGNAGQVVRVGDTVRRPVGPYSPATRALLDHLAARGFDGAPRHLGHDDRGREVLTFLPGDVAVHEEPPAWCGTDEALVSVVALVRRLHEAARGFVAPAGADWAWPPPEPYRTDLVGHNDLCPANVVFRDGRAAALIDFDFAGPSSPEWEMAGLVRHWVLPMPGDRVTRARLACATYGVDATAVAQALMVRMDWGLRMVRARMERGEPGFVAMWEHRLEERHRAMRDWIGAELTPDRLDG